jgi:GNAT superfamily N-acetyltransferase
MVEFWELTSSTEDLAKLETFYESLYVPEFPDPDERESLENMERYLRLKAQGWYGRNDYHILLATEAEKPLAGAVADFFAEAVAGVIEFLVVAPSARRLGLGRAMHERIEHLLITDAREQLGRELSFIAAEMTDPFIPTDVKDYFDPTERALVWHSWGYRALDFPYVQPPLSDAQGSVTSLILIAKLLHTSTPDGLRASAVKTLIHQYLRWAMRIDRPETCREYRDMAEHLEARHTVRAHSLAAYVGRDPERPLVIHEVQEADDLDFARAMSLYRATFAQDALAVDEHAFRSLLAAISPRFRYHLWTLRASIDAAVEGFASFFVLPSAGFGGYIALSGTLRGTGRFPLLIARIEEQMLRDRATACGWYAETALTANLKPFLSTGFHELDVDFVQPALKARQSPARVRLIYKPFGRQYGPPSLSRRDVLAAVKDILQVVYGITDPVRHPSYTGVVGKLGLDRGNVAFR